MSISISAGQDIPLKRSNVILHQPTLYEIAYCFFEEDIFYTTIYTFSDLQSLGFQNNFKSYDILVAILNVDDDSNVSALKDNFLKVFDLYFPLYDIIINPNNIQFKFKDNDKLVFNFDDKCFEEFIKYFKIINCMEDETDQKDKYNPMNKKADEIAKKLKKGREEAARLQGKGNKSEGSVAIIEIRASVVSIGLHLNINTVYKEYTVYQLFKQYHRFEVKLLNEMAQKSAMFGGKIDEDMKNWFIDDLR